MRDNTSGGALTETTLLVLLSLYREMHGYGIRQWIEDKTEGRVALGMGTLYGAIGNLEKRGWIVQSSRRDTRVNYLLTDAGREQVLRERARLKALMTLIDHVTEAENEKNQVLL